MLAEEMYHVAFGIVHETSPATYKAVERWYRRCLNSGADPTISLDEAFSKAMGLEEAGKASGLPRGVVRYAQDVVSADATVSDSVMERIKGINGKLCEPLGQGI